MRAGFIDPAEEHARRPLADHLADYAAFLDAKGDVPAHVRQTRAKIAALLDGCGFILPLEADAAKAAAWLNALRRDAAPVELPPGDPFAPAEPRADRL